MPATSPTGSASSTSPSAPPSTAPRSPTTSRTPPASPASSKSSPPPASATPRSSRSPGATGAAPWRAAGTKPDEPLVGVGRQQLEGAALKRSGGPEVTLVEGQHAPRPEPPGQDDRRAIREAELEIRVAGVEAHDLRILLGSERGYLVSTRGEIGEKGASGAATESPTKQVVDLSARRRRHDQGTGLGREEFEDLRRERVVAIRQRDHRPRIEDQGHSPKPASSSSSGIAEVGRGSESIRVKPAARAKLRSPGGAGS